MSQTNDFIDSNLRLEFTNFHDRIDEKGSSGADSRQKAEGKNSRFDSVFTYQCNTLVFKDLY